MSDTQNIYWLSFCDPTKPQGHAFLGVAIVQADDFSSAIQTAWDQSINPGGEVVGVELPDAVYDLVRDSLGRLLSKDEATSLNDLVSAATSVKH